MPSFDYSELAFVQIACFSFSILWMLRRNDEIPLLISSLLGYVASYRYWAVTHGINDWVNLTNFGVPTITEEMALTALPYIVIGQVCVLTTYWVNQSEKIPILQTVELTSFFTWLTPKVLLLGLLCLPLVTAVRNIVASQVASGSSLSYQVSGYLFQFPFVLVGISTLVLCLWKFGGLPELWQKAAAIAILIGVGQLSFQLSGRFQFLGCLATAAIILASSLQPKKRLLVLSSFVIIAIALFGAAGAMRGDVAEGELRDAALERLLSAEDANMLDGFVILQYAVPSLSEFRWGGAHFEVLARPIPRAIWAGKPAGGGYMVEAGLSDPTTGLTVGISPTIFGDFYSEAGLLGIFFFAIVYGVALAKIVCWSVTLHPFAGILVRSMICAALVPVLRGGDLPGIFAWLGMAFWPCLIILWFKHQQLGPYWEWYNQQDSSQASSTDTDIAYP